MYSAAKKKLPYTLLIATKSAHHCPIRKQGGRVKSWKDRHFVLFHNLLLYYKKQKDEYPTGYINLFQAQITQPAGNPKQIKINVPRGKAKRQEYLLEFANATLAQSWLHLLKLEAASTQVSTDEITNYGFLLKYEKNGINSWKNKYFALRGNLLFYYNKLDSVALHNLSQDVVTSPTSTTSPSPSTAAAPLPVSNDGSNATSNSLTELSPPNYNSNPISASSSSSNITSNSQLEPTQATPLSKRKRTFSAFGLLLPKEKDGKNANGTSPPSLPNSPSDDKLIVTSKKADPLIYFLQTCPKGAISILKNSIVIHLKGDLTKQEKLQEEEQFLKFHTSFSNERGSPSSSSTTINIDEDQVMIDKLSLHNASDEKNNNSTPAYSFRIITKDIKGQVKFLYFKHSEKDIVHQWVYHLQKTIMDSWSADQKVISVDNEDEMGPQKLNKELEEERKNWREKYKGKDVSLDYPPVKFVLTGSKPFILDKTIVLDFPVELEGKGKVCLKSEDDYPTISIASVNVRIKNLTIRHADCEDVTAVHIQSGFAHFIKCTISSKGHCIYVSANAEAYIGNCIIENGQSGIRVSKQAHVTCEHSVITKQTDSGIKVDEDGSLRLVKNKIASNNYGVKASSLNLSLSDNYISRNSREDLSGLAFQSSFDLEDLLKRGNVVQPLTPRQMMLGEL